MHVNNESNKNKNPLTPVQKPHKTRHNIDFSRMMEDLADEPSDDYEEYVCRGSTNEDIFDVIIGHIEDIIVAPEFIQLQHDFMEAHYSRFEDCEENKLEYMDIFNKYTELIEKHIERVLTGRIPEFSMKDFLDQIVNRHRREELDGEIFDILVSFTDFIAFKDMFLDYKAAKDGRMPDLFLKNDSTACKSN